MTNEERFTTPLSGAETQKVELEGILDQIPEEIKERFTIESAAILTAEQSEHIPTQLRAKLLLAAFKFSRHDAAVEFATTILEGVKEGVGSPLSGLHALGFEHNKRCKEARKHFKDLLLQCTKHFERNKQS